ncbi:carbohydrate ABC transporter permease [Paenibacillus hexagrammi]|uniref:Sugar ABC transporter permease n=1 Tax=Paenibacillus hexagrammi TaxID=2908839 RepID=A0ABY3SSU9_9BACL|nr:sugar ABC transporter permease [Paenibacillus sp. YPD9-1]UJF36465.1 sugar ABC transporter permease [Paenibacillus sp. YPD9-1]
MSVTTAKANAPKRTSFLYSKTIAPYVFVLPFLITFFVFFAYPVLSTIQMSFQEVLPGATKYIGLRNYEKLFNTHFYRAIYNSFIYTILTLVVLIPLPLVFAVFLNSKMMIFKNFFRSTLFVPALVSVVVAGTIFRMMFGELENSFINSLLGVFGVDKMKWLGSAKFGMLTLVLLATWRWLGVNIIYFLSGLQNIPAELYESAEIDGATTWTKFTRITVPLLKPVTIYVLTISVFGGLSMFIESYMLWSGNRSPNDIGLTMVGYIYQQGIEQNNFGMGSAIGLVLLAFMLLLNMLQLKIFGLFNKED